MAYHLPEKFKRAFEACHTTVFIYSDNRRIGFGRAIYEGEYQTAIDDCAVWLEYQGRGIGSLIVQNILKQVPGYNIILYTSPGKEGFYQNHAFRRTKTGLALFTESAAKRDNGFTK